MDKSNIIGWDNSYERIGRQQGAVYYTLEVYADETEEVAYKIPLDISNRAEIEKEVLENALVKWAEDHDVEVHSWRLTESMTCAVGGVGDLPPTVPEPSDRGRTSKPYLVPLPSGERETFDDLDVEAMEGETIEFYPGGQASVYGTKRGTVLGVGPGPDDKQCLIVRTDSGKKKVREDWLVPRSFANPGDDS